MGEKIDSMTTNSKILESKISAPLDCFSADYFTVDRLLFFIPFLQVGAVRYRPKPVQVDSGLMAGQTKLN